MEIRLWTDRRQPFIVVSEMNITDGDSELFSSCIFSVLFSKKKNVSNFFFLAAQLDFGTAVEKTVKKTEKKKHVAYKPTLVSTRKNFISIEC